MSVDESRGNYLGGSFERAGGCWEAVRTVSVRTTTAGPMSTLGGALIQFTSSGYLIQKPQATRRVHVSSIRRHAGALG